MMAVAGPAPEAREENKSAQALTAKQAATFLRVGLTTIKNYERRGLLCPVGSNGEETLYDLKDVHEILRGKDRKRWSHLKEGVDTTAWMTRTESTSFLNCSPQTLKNYEKRGMLHPLRTTRRDARGHEQVVAIYDPQELRKLPRGVGRPPTPREAATVESRCFALFSEGKTIREVVIALNETSDRIRELHARWVDDGDMREVAKEREATDRAVKDLESRCFALFSEGKTIREVVIEMRETSDRIRELREKWFDDGGADLVISNVAKRAFEKLLGPFQDVTELLEIVTARMATPHASLGDPLPVSRATRAE